MRTAAVYDTETEGRTGWRFVLTRRWLIYLVCVAVYVAGCGAAVVWQAQRQEQVASFNATVTRNFHRAPVPLADAVAAVDAYDPAKQWRPVTIEGRYRTDLQIVVRGRECAGETGFEVLTPIQLVSGRLFVVDRGCVLPSARDMNVPGPIPAPPNGQVTVTARLVAGEERAGAGKVVGDQIRSVDLPALAHEFSAPTYSRAYGMLAGQRPQPAAGLLPVVTGPPLVDGSSGLALIVQVVLYAAVGLFLLGYGLREKFRFVNRFDPRLWAHELKRIQRLAHKPYTDAEIEDLMLDRAESLARAPASVAGRERGPVGDGVRTGCGRSHP